MKTIVLGAGIVGVAAAWYLAKSGHEVDVIERQPAAGLETSLANGCVIHVSEVEPWSRPGMPLKVLQWIGKEDAPLLLRLGALPQMWRWGFDFAQLPVGTLSRECTEQSGPCSAVATLTVGDRRRDRYRVRPRGARCSQNISLEGGARSGRALMHRTRCSWAAV